MAAMRLRRPNHDIVRGILFAAMGLAAVAGAAAHERGTALNMGPGYVPLAAGLMLMLLGVAILIRDSLAPKTNAIERLSQRPFAVLIAVVLFALLIEPAGFLLAAATLAGIASLATSESTRRERLLLSVTLTAAAFVIFVRLLGLPFAALPSLGYR